MALTGKISINFKKIYSWARVFKPFFKRSFQLFLNRGFSLWGGRIRGVKVKIRFNPNLTFKKGLLPLCLPS